MGKFFGIVGGVLAAAAAFITIYTFVFRHHAPSFSGNVSQYAGARNFISFLRQNDTQGVSLDVTCDVPSSQPGCTAAAGPGSTGIELMLYSSQAAANCWTTTDGAGPCSGGALITFIIDPGASGTVASPGAGYYEIEGSWTILNQGSGGTSPEGDPAYELESVSPQ
jgi:hypothetical protein